MFVIVYSKCLIIILSCGNTYNNTLNTDIDVFDFFGVVQLTYSFIEGSAIRHAVLERISANINSSLKTMKSLSTTRWACLAITVPQGCRI